MGLDFFFQNVVGTLIQSYACKAGTQTSVSPNLENRDGVLYFTFLEGKKNIVALKM